MLFIISTDTLKSSFTYKITLDVKLLPSHCRLIKQERGGNLSKVNLSFSGVEFELLRHSAPSGKRRETYFLCY